MKKLTLLFTMVAFLALQTAFAHNHQGQKKSAEERAKSMTERLTERLSLSQDQSAAIYVINLESAQRMQVMKETTTQDNKEQARAAFKEIQQNRDTRIKAVLNTQQVQQYEAYKAEMKEKRKGQMKNKNHHGKSKGEYNRNK